MKSCLARFHHSMFYVDGLPRPAKAPKTLHSTATKHESIQGSKEEAVAAGIDGANEGRRINVELT